MMWFSVKELDISINVLSDTRCAECQTYLVTARTKTRVLIKHIHAFYDTLLVGIQPVKIRKKSLKTGNPVADACKSVKRLLEHHV